MDMTFTIKATNPAGVDHVTSTLAGPGYSQTHDSHPEGEAVVFDGIPGAGTFTLTSQAYADRDDPDHTVGDPFTVTVTIAAQVPTPISIS